jgi:hypothetical protein
MQQTVANFGDHQDSSPFMDFQNDEMDFSFLESIAEVLNQDYVDHFFAIVWLFKPTYASSCPIEV